MSELRDIRPHYNEEIARTTKGEGVSFSDPMNKFIDDLIDEIDAIDASVDDGWAADSSNTWTFATTSTFTIASIDVTAKFPTGAKIKLTNDGSVKYFYVKSAAFSTDTTITITGGSDYALVSGAITSPFTSYLSTPQGFPQWFAFTPTYNNLTIGNGTSSYAFRVDGREVSIQGVTTFGTTTSIASDAGITVPFTMVGGVEFQSLGTASFLNSGTNVHSGWVVYNTTTIISFWTARADATYISRQALGATAPFTWTTNDKIMFTAHFRI